MERIVKIIPKYTVYFFTLLFFLIPFLWLKPGEMDLGGDSSRLYFYDPVSYLFSHTLYGISSSGIGAENISYYALPFIMLLILGKFILGSPTMLISVFNGFSLAISFFSIYFIIRDLLLISKIPKNPLLLTLSGTIGGVFYVLSPVLIMTWDKVILTHSQIFLNPLIFFLLLRFIISDKSKYLWAALIITFIFSHNFGYTAAPPIFAFYPVTILFLLAVRVLILKKKLPFLHIGLAIILFLGLQSFHLIPQLASLLTPGSAASQSIFSDQAKFSRGMQYFIDIAPSVKISNNFFSISQEGARGFLRIFSFLFPAIILLGFLGKRSRVFILTAVIFLITLFFASANVTDLGFTIYRSLFQLPGFSMFRNFYGQWLYAYYFFYAILIGQAFYLAFIYRRINFSLGAFCIVVLVLFINAIPFITGELMNKTWWQSKDVKIVMRMDPQYEKALSYMRSLPESGKVLTLPLTDPGYQTVMGEGNAAYQGPSTIAYLTGKKDFAGITELGIYSDPFSKAVIEKDYDSVMNILHLLNIRYIFYNSDPKIYEKYFPSFPYADVKRVLPATQEGYQRFLKNLQIREVKRFGNVVIYEVPGTTKVPISIPANYISIDSKDMNWDYLKTKNFEKDHLFFAATDGIQEESTVINIEGIDQSSLIVKDYPIEVVFPFVRWNTQSPFYWIVTQREEESKKTTTDPIDKINLHMNLAAKRISEIDSFGQHLQVTKDWQKDTDKNFQTDRFKHDSWEWGLARYYSEMNDAIKLVTEKDLLVNNRIVAERKILQVLRGHKNKLNDILTRSQDNAYLVDVVDGIFTTLEKRLAVTPIDSMQYRISGLMTPGNFSLVAAYDPSLNIHAENMLVLYQDTLVPVQSIDHESQLASFGNIAVDTRTRLLSLRLQNADPITPEIAWKLGSAVDDRSAKIIQPDKNIYEFPGGEKRLLIGGIPDWKQGKKYKITFDYVTFGKSYEFSFFTQESKKTSDITTPSAKALFREKKNARVWTEFTIIIDTDIATSGSTVIENTSDTGGKIGIKNFNISELYPQPVLNLESKTVIKNLQVPKYQSIMINPTKYAVSVRGVKSPVVLVLPQQFDNNWQLYLSKSDEFPKKSYGRFSISNVFNLNMLQSFTEKKINPLHFTVNGYANGWKITPKDLDNMKDATIIVEFKTQKLFYIGGSLTLISLLVTLALFGWSFRDEYKK